MKAYVDGRTDFSLCSVTTVTRRFTFQVKTRDTSARALSWFQSPSLVLAAHPGDLEGYATELGVPLNSEFRDLNSHLYNSSAGYKSHLASAQGIQTTIVY